MLRNGMLTWLRRKVKDPFRPERYVSVCWFVAKPTTADPYPALFLSLSNGPRSRVMFRFHNLAAFDDAFRLSGEERTRLNLMVNEAQIQAAEIWEDKRLASMRRELATGETMVIKRKAVPEADLSKPLPGEDHQDYLVRLYPGCEAEDATAEAQRIVNERP